MTSNSKQQVRRSVDSKKDKETAVSVRSYEDSILDQKMANAEQKPSTWTRIVESLSA
jgi:hypothetical protein